jgi:tRNA nucleotidyltransferase/poly(A) polymerase
MEKLISKLNNNQFICEIINCGGEVYVVGGAVRDSFLGKKNKDIDLVIRLINVKKLIEILKNFGKVDVVGESFGVIKFVSNEDKLEYDIALPRKEKSSGQKGHKAFIIESDEKISIESDLSRRDVTVNSMAVNVATSNIIDPFNGQKDLVDRIIRVVNKEAFADDPLRMIRAIQFAARFNMYIEEDTEILIKDNVHRIREIAGERILEELRKVIDKGGDPLYTADLLRTTGLYEQISGLKAHPNWQHWWDKDQWDNIKTLGEFLFMLFHPCGLAYETANEVLKADRKTLNEIKSLVLSTNSHSIMSFFDKRMLCFQIYKSSPEILKSKVLPKSLWEQAEELLNGNYPISFAELAVNGDDLLKLGFKGKLIGDKLNEILIEVYSDTLLNNKENIMERLK